MPFKHKIETEKDIIVLKGWGKISVRDIITEIQLAMRSRRGEGLSMRLIDLTAIEFNFTHDGAHKIFGMMQRQAKALRPKRVALLFKEIPDSFNVSEFKNFLHSELLEIDLFTDRKKAIEFLLALNQTE